MTRYAIKVVPPEWRDTMPLPFNKAMHDSSGIEQGTRVLVYRTGEGIVGEGEVHGYFVRPREWTEAATDGLPPSFRDADYLLPLGMLYTRADPIAPAQVKAALDDPTFPQNDAWRPIDQDVYQTLTNFPS